LNPALLIDELVTRGLVTHDAVELVASNKAHFGKAVEVALMDEGLVGEPELLTIMSELFQIPFCHITPDELDLELAEDVPRRLLTNFCVFPLRRRKDSDVQPLATIDPFDVTAADIFRQLTGRDVQYVLVPRAEIQGAINGQLVGSRAFNLLVEQVPVPPEWENLQSLIKSEANQLSENSSPIIMLVDSIFREAIRLNASDIHLEPHEKCFRIRYRLDGILKIIAELPKRAAKTCVSRIKIMADIDISETRKAQDGAIPLSTKGGNVNLRVSTVPTPFGEKIVLRILDESATQLALPQLGFSSEHLNALHTHLASSTGMILITGPTGSGKTSTLYAALRILNDPVVNVVTVEDPIEYRVPGITQVQVNPRAGLTFASSLRAFLRQDPDVIMVGEIRDLVTAETAVQAAQSGHLVLSTLHTNNAPSTLARLVLLGVEPHLVASGLLCVVAQRLVRKICKSCLEPTETKAEHEALLGLAVEQQRPKRLFLGKGCSECDGTGYKGRMGLYEILTITSALRRQLVLDAKEETLWRVAREEGMRSLLEDGIDKVEKGLTSLDEVLRVVTIRRTSQGENGPTSRSGIPMVVSSSEDPRFVEDVMVRTVVTIHPLASVSEALNVLVYRGITGCPVVDKEGNVVGIVSYRDLASLIKTNSRKNARKNVSQIMSDRVISVRPTDTLKDAAQKMWRHKIHRLVVLHEDKLVGILTPFDLMLRTNLFAYQQAEGHCTKV
jgi:type IV pilus assembly protein PilB